MNEKSYSLKIQKALDVETMTYEQLIAVMKVLSDLYSEAYSAGAQDTIDRYKYKD